VNAYKLKLENKDGKTIFYFIDPSTYYIIKGETTTKVNGQDITTTSIFSNHTKTDIGLVIPYTTVVNNQGVKSTITVKKVEHNKDIDPKIFEMPK
jgi:outer membrane lipoprotein-sorting protein